MARVKRGVTAHAKQKKVLKAAKGYYGRRKPRRPWTRAFAPHHLGASTITT